MHEPKCGVHKNTLDLFCDVKLEYKKIRNIDKKIKK